jgi:hypothetical protein
VTRLDPPTFLECERLASFASDCAGRARALEAAAQGNQAIARQYRADAERHEQIAEILAWLGARSTRLHTLTEPVRR